MADMGTKVSSSLSELLLFPIEVRNGLQKKPDSLRQLTVREIEVHAKDFQSLTIANFYVVHCSHSAD